MIRVAILGNKGGSGKTLLSHILCYGLAVHGVEAYHFTTDQSRHVLAQDGRYYATLDGRDHNKMRRALDLLTKREGVVVIDGCANRPETDAALAELADVALVPFQASAEDMRVAKTDLVRLPSAFGVPMRWPSNLWQRTFTDRLLTRYLVDEMPRISDPVFSKSALATLLLDEPPDIRIASICREIAADLLRRGGFTIEDDGPAAS